MKKILLSLLTIFVSLCANAQIVFNFDNDYQAFFPELKGVSSGTGDNYVADGELLSDQTIMKDGVTIVIKASAADASIRNRIWSTAPRLRMYNESFSISAAGHKVTKIVFKGHSTNFNISTTTGTLSGKEWYGSAESIEFSVAKNTQINTITVTVDGEAETPKEPVNITNTPETAYTTSQAFDLIKADEGLDKEVYVKGTVSKVQEIDTGDYGNATYFITDGTNELEIYRGYGLGGQKFTSTDDLQDGDEVIVYGKLVDYKGTYEMTTGSKIYSLNGKTQTDNPGGDNPGAGDDPQPPYTVVGKGTFEDPYTTEDIIKGVYKEGELSADILVWVKGTILGCFGSAKEPISTKETVASNIAIGNADGTNVIPVQLVYTKDGDNHVREGLNILDNPDNVGKEVWVYGSITKYFSVAGMKSTYDYSFDGKTTSINGVNMTSAPKVIFNMTGQKLNNVQKGINIIDGKKVYVK